MKRFLASIATAALVVSGFTSVGTGKVEAATVTKVKITDNGLRVRQLLLRKQASSGKSTLVKSLHTKANQAAGQKSHTAVKHVMSSHNTQRHTNHL